jgi:hypothetical protein
MTTSSSRRARALGLDDLAFDRERGPNVGQPDGAFGVIPNLDHRNDVVSGDVRLHEINLACAVLQLDARRPGGLRNCARSGQQRERNRASQKCGTDRIVRFDVCHDHCVFLFFDDIKKVFSYPWNQTDRDSFRKKLG